MKPLFRGGVHSTDKSLVNYYKAKDKQGKIHVGVTIDTENPEYYIYPYDLAWRTNLEEYGEVPELHVIEDEIKSNITLRDDQEPYVQELSQCPRGVFISNPGTGKTVMMLELISRLKLKTLVLVNTSYLLHQWETECKKLLNYEPGIIGDGKYIVKDITIGTFQTLARSNAKLKEIKEKFSLVIVDECHHCPAATFKYVLSSLSVLFKLGVTGTFRRKDGLEFLTNWMLSDRKVINKTDNTLVPKIIRVNTGIKVHDGESFIESLSGLAEDKKLAEIITQMVKRNPERNQLVLSARLATVEILAEMNPNAIVLTGEQGDRNDLDKRLQQKKLIISTILGEGVNLPSLDTVHLIHPNNNIPQLEQRIARVNRPKEGKLLPLVYDYRYKSNRKALGYNVLKQQQERDKYYLKKGYKVYDITP